MKAQSKKGIMMSASEDKERAGPVAKGGWKEALMAGLKTLAEILYGMTAHELDLELKREKGNLHNLFLLVVFGDLVGLPLLPPYYSMRFLPYVIPYLEIWKRSTLREKDLTEFVARDI